MSSPDSIFEPQATLTGLGPPEPMTAEEPETSRTVPETLRPVSIPDDVGDDVEAELAKLRVPFSPVVPGWSKVALWSAALVVSGSVGLFLGRGPLSPAAAGGAPPELPAPTTRVVKTAVLVPSPAPTPSTETGTETETETETDVAPPSPSAEAEPGGEPEEAPPPKKHRHRHSTPGAAAAASAAAAPSAIPVPNPERIRSVAEGVQLDDENASADDSATR